MQSKEIPKELEYIPKALVYEMVEGRPIYYRDYRAYLSGEKTHEEIMGSGYLQSLLIGKLVSLLYNSLGADYKILTNELGIQFGEKSWRAADIAVYRASALQGKSKDNKYIDIPPSLIIEVDTKAELQDLENPFSYYQQKTEELMQFGVEKVIWIFTDTHKILIATPGTKWEITNWNDPVPCLGDLELNIQDIFDSL